MLIEGSEEKNGIEIVIRMYDQQQTTAKKECKKQWGWSEQLIDRSTEWMDCDKFMRNSSRYESWEIEHNVIERWRCGEKERKRANKRRKKKENDSNLLIQTN